MAGKSLDAKASSSSRGAEASSTDESAPNFETALAQLEALVAQMEDGTLPLDESLAAYKKGVELAKICQKRLDVAEQQVKVLQGNLLLPLGDSPDPAED